MIKLIASDMDGTLLNSNHEISEGNREAIKVAREQGLHFTIVTGRNYEMVEPFLSKYNIECECILMNGAEYRDKYGKIIESINIEESTMKRILDIFKQSKLIPEIFTGKGIYTIKEENKDRVYERVRSYSPNMTDEEIDKHIEERDEITKTVYLDKIDDFIGLNIEVSKIITYHQDAKFIAKVKDELSKIEGIAVAGTFSNDIEISNVEAQKGLILAKVIKKMNIDKSEVIVIGDSFNDYSMFTEFENSYAMENAIPEIKAIAKHITTSNDNDGVAKAIYECIG